MTYHSSIRTPHSAFRNPHSRLPMIRCLDCGRRGRAQLSASTMVQGPGPFLGAVARIGDERYVFHCPRCGGVHTKKES